MSTPLVCEPADYATASQAFARVREESGAIVTALTGALSGTSGMAGSDDVGHKFASAYDPAVKNALQASSSVVTGAGQIADLLAASGVNHATADSSSTLGTQPAHAEFQGPTGPYAASDVPGSGGGTGGGPPGWSLIQPFVGRMWPNGHQDKLHAAGAAWANAARTIADAQSPIPRAVALLQAQKSPEIPAAVQACNGMGSHLNELTGVYTALGTSCNEYAAHIDQAHHEILSEMRQLAVEMAFITVLGAATGGIGELIAGAGDRERFLAGCARIAAIIDKLAGQVATVASRVTALTARVGEISQKLAKLLAARVRLFASEAQGTVPAFSRTEAAAAQETRENAWQKYLANKAHDGTTPMSRPQWDAKYDTMLTNKTVGDGVRDQVMEQLGIRDGANGWSKETPFKTSDGKTRRFDFGNAEDRVGYEVKSGSNPESKGMQQMSRDEEAVKRGWQVHWILKQDLSPKQMARLQELT